MNQKAYARGLVTGVAIFYAPILLACILSSRGLSDFNVLWLAPIAGLLDSAAKLKMWPMKAVGLMVNYFLLLGFVFLPLLKDYSHGRQTVLYFLGWFALIWLLLWNFVCVSGGA